MKKKDFFTNASLIACALTLTFSIPGMQWVVGKFIPDSEYQAIISSLSIILCISYWNNNLKAFTFQPSSHWWRVLYYFLLVATIGLILFNLQKQPVSKITAEARSPLEVIDVAILVPIAEEMVFRGVIWSILDKLAKGNLGQITVLTGVSLMFGVEHLGYWTQASRPLPHEAYLHAFSMVFAGLFFGFFKIKSNSIAIPAVLHMLSNNVILLTQ